MMLRHPGETGICIDHWAAFEVVETQNLKSTQHSLSVHTRKREPFVWVQRMAATRCDSQVVSLNMITA